MTNFWGFSVWGNLNLIVVLLLVNIFKKSIPTSLLEVGIDF